MRLGAYENYSGNSGKIIAYWFHEICLNTTFRLPPGLEPGQHGAIIEKNDAHCRSGADQRHGTILATDRPGFNN